jgi:hypothetical protein
MRRTAVVLAGVALAVVPACGAGRPPVLGVDAVDSCAGLGADSCGRAKGLLQAATAFSQVSHELILDPTSSFAHGRGLVRQGGGDGAWSAIPTQCARPVAQASGASRVDAATIDFGFVGVAVDNVLVGADADLTPFLAVGGDAALHKVRLVAIAFVRELDPQFFEATEEVGYVGEACACRSATHFVGAVKMGGMLAFELTIRSGEARGKALEFFRARFAARDTTLVETRVGGLEVDGLEGQLAGDGGAMRPLSFRVTNPVPVAYAVYPISDVCKFAFPEPEVTPVPVDFGEVPYGNEGSRLVHVVNRAPFDLTGTVGRRTFDVPARGAVDVPVVWVPTGNAPGCELQERDESIRFTPRSPTVPAVPRERSVRLPELVRTGRGTVQRAEHVDTGEPRRSPDYAATQRDWPCPPDHVVSSCTTQSARCGSDKAPDCAGDGYAIVAEPRGNGCHFRCTGPSAMLLGSHFCRFDAVMQCRLACGKK